MIGNRRGPSVPADGGGCALCMEITNQASWWMPTKTSSTAVAVEEVFVGIHQEAWLVISMHRAQPPPSAGTEGPRRLPIMGLQIAHQGNLLFQVVEILTIHGLLASKGRIRQTALRSQARMVGARKKRWPMAPAFAQQHTLSRRRWAHRRRVEGSGERAGSW